MRSTRPVSSFESADFVPAECRLSPLALTALDFGISEDDVASYVRDRAAFLSAPYRLTQVAIELLGSGALMQVTP